MAEATSPASKPEKPAKAGKSEQPATTPAAAPAETAPAPATEAQSGEASELWESYGRRCLAAVDVLKERCRQVEGEGYTPEQDDAYTDYQLPRAAICYGIKAAGLPDHLERLYWPFRSSAVKPANRRRSLVKAAALLLAEIERLDRAENPTD